MSRQIICSFATSASVIRTDTASEDRHPCISSESLSLFYDPTAMLRKRRMQQKLFVHYVNHWCWMKTEGRRLIKDGRSKTGWHDKKLSWCKILKLQSACTCHQDVKHTHTYCTKLMSTYTDRHSPTSKGQWQAPCNKKRSSMQHNLKINQHAVVFIEECSDSASLKCAQLWNTISGGTAINTSNQLQYWNNARRLELGLKIMGSVILRKVYNNRQCIITDS